MINAARFDDTRSRRNTRSRRTLPHNLDAEQSILGGILLRNEVLADLGALDVDVFYDHRNKVVFQAMRALEHRATPIDVTLLQVEIERQGKLDAIGGISYLAELLQHYPTPDSVKHYAEEVQDRAFAREAALLSSELTERSSNYDGDGGADELIAEGIAKFSLLDAKMRGKSKKSPLSGLRLIDCVPQLVANRTAPILKTGLAELDKLCEVMAGSVVLLIGGPGSGKSTLTLQLAQHHADVTGPALFVSLELSAPELAARIVAQTCDVSWFGALRGEVSDAVMRAALNKERFRVIDDAVLRVSQIRNHVLALQREYPGKLLLLVVDYAQLLAAEGKDMRERMSVASNALRALAKELSIVVWLVSQASRSGAKELRKGEATGRDASDTGAESSQLERDAYVTLSLGEMTDSDEPGITYVDLSVGKVRMGAPDRIIPLRYDGRRGVWRDNGEPITAKARRDERAAEKKSKGANPKRTEGTMHSIVGLLDLSGEPLSGKKIRDELGINQLECSTAIARLLGEDTPRVVEVCGRKLGGCYPLWTLRNATNAGVDVLPRRVP